LGFVPVNNSMLLVPAQQGKSPLRRPHIFSGEDYVCIEIDEACFP